jgi:predicted nucleic acid-binding protein
MPSVFIDTNILIYARETTDPTKALTCEAWLSRLADSRSMVISRQVMNELYANLIYKRHLKRPAAEARREVLALEPFATAPANAATLASAWDIQDRFGLHFWDALLVASANAADCDFFLSEDLSDQQLYGRVRVINPFRHSPVDVLGRAP